MKLSAALLLVVVGMAAGAALPKQSHSKAWVTSGHYQGDIILTPAQRNGITNSRGYWPNRTVPYAITGSFSNADRNTILAAINWYNANTCLRWVPRTNEANYVNIGNSNSGCYSYVGVIGGAQELNLQTPGCVYHDIVVHEMLHALGFFHQQSATDRDNYVTIQWQNIQRGMESNFDKYDANTVTDFGVGYDYGSVMHYGAYDFSANGQKTIQTKDPNVVIGEAPGLSGKDIAKLQAMYKC